MILSLIGLIAVIATLYVNFTTDLLVYPAQLVLLGVGAAIALAGIVFDVMAKLPSKRILNSILPKSSNSTQDFSRLYFLLRV